MPESALRIFAFAFLLLLFYSFLGWCGEMIYCSILQRHLCEKRGFLNGPICPIYGHGALLVLLALHGGGENPVLTFLLGGILTTVLEYVTSFVMEKLFHMRWWDYSHMHFNLFGRVCLWNSCLFGLACVLLCHAVHPAVARGVTWLIQKGIGVPLALVLAVVYATDTVVSVLSAIHIRSRLEKLHVLYDELGEKLEQLREEQRVNAETQRDRLETGLASARQTLEQHKNEVQAKQAKMAEDFSTRVESARAEIQQRIHTLCENQGFFERRLMHAFPSMHSPRHGEALKKLREYWENHKK